MKYKLFIIGFILSGYCTYGQSQVEQDLCIPRSDDRFNNEYYVLSHSMPKYPGGKAGLDEFLQKQYKKQKLPFEGTNTTYASFIVDIDGSIKNLRFLRPPSETGVLQKLEKAIAKMPKWVPGECDNKVVPVLYNLPLKY